MNEKLTHSQVKNYYGKVLKTTDDLKSDACCTDNDVPSHLKPILYQVYEEVLKRYYGCGTSVPFNESSDQPIGTGACC